MTGILTIPSDAYHLDTVATQPSLSSSIARTLLSRSPLHAWSEHPKLGGVIGKDTDAMDIGTILHSVILEGDLSKIAVLEVDDFRTKAAREMRDDARANGLIPIKAANWAEMQTAIDTVTKRIAAHGATPDLFKDGKPEQTLVWKEGSVTCRARLDWLRDDLTAIDDLKTTAMSVSPLALQRSVFNAGYDVQAAFYLRGLKILTGKDAQFRFVFVEVEPPHDVTVIDLSPAALALANEKVQFAIDIWRKCLMSGNWPGYTTRVATLDPPAWAEQAFYERTELAA